MNRGYLKPTFTEESIAALGQKTEQSRALDGRKYRPGIVGLNNIKANDYVNVVVQILTRVEKFRSYFLKESNYSHCMPFFFANQCRTSYN